jgi:hypothetical protein
MTTFFIPDHAPGGTSEKDAYAAIRKLAQTHTGHEPQEERIFKLWCRRGGVDCEAEVGKPDPVCGETVIAIVDLGRHCPYLIHCGSPGGRITQVIVEKPVYAVTAFASLEEGLA